jgi:hypothetical protein
MKVYLASFICTFLAVALKGYQHKNVIGNHIKSVCFVAYLMYVFDVLAVTLIVKNNWWVVFTSAFGASLGMYVSIKLHTKIHKTTCSNNKRTS